MPVRPGCAELMGQWMTHASSAVPELISYVVLGRPNMFV